MNREQELKTQLAWCYAGLAFTVVQLAINLISLWIILWGDVNPITKIVLIGAHAGYFVGQTFQTMERVIKKKKG